MSDPTVEFIEEVTGALKLLYGAAGKDAADQIGGISFDYIDEMAEKYGMERGGELVGMKNVDGQWVPNPNAEWVIDETTRERTNELLQEAMSEGWSPQKFGEALRPLYDEERADMIARTEVGIAQNYGQAETAAVAGFDRFYIFDGDCPECEEFDGRVASLAWVLDNPLQHPNCVRAVSPAPDDEEIDLE